MRVIQQHRGVLKDYLAVARRWAVGRLPFIRLVLLIVIFYAWVRHIQNPHYAGLFFGLNLGIHELGHVVMAPFGQFLMVLGGSLVQCLVPIIGLVMFLRQKDHFGVAFTFGWEATNLYYVATYIADARAMKLPLITPFGKEAYHDWHWLLAKTGLLRQDILIATLVRILASACMLICLAYGGWLVWIMFRSFGRKLRTA